MLTTILLLQAEISIPLKSLVYQPRLLSAQQSMINNTKFNTNSKIVWQFLNLQTAIKTV